MQRPTPALDLRLRLTVLAILIPVAVIGLAQEWPGVAPQDYTVIALGDTVEFGAGHSITVSKFENDIPFEVTLIDWLGPERWVADLAYARICAGSTGLQEDIVSEARFELWSWELEDWVPKFADGSSTPSVVREPRLSYREPAITLPPGECREGWVVFSDKFTDTVAPGAVSVGFSPAGAVSKDRRVTFAWKLPERAD